MGTVPTSTTMSYTEAITHNRLANTIENLCRVAVGSRIRYWKVSDKDKILIGTIRCEYKDSLLSHIGITSHTTRTRNVYLDHKGDLYVVLSITSRNYDEERCTLFDGISTEVESKLDVHKLYFDDLTRINEFLVFFIQEQLN